MQTITDELLKTHLVVRKVLEGLDVNNKRFTEIIKTLHKTILSHTWFQDEILIPVLRDKPFAENKFLDEIILEHKHLDVLLKDLLDTSLDYKNELEAKILNLRIIIERHFKKESEILYPIANSNINLETLYKLGEGFVVNQEEVRELVWD